MGLVIALLILIYQLHYGIILHAYERGALFSVLWPYSFAVFVTLAWEALMTWLELRKEDAAIGEGEAALFRHYSACSYKLASSLEMAWHHWNTARTALAHPLRGDESGNGLGSEIEAFRVIYSNHLEWLAFEIPEFDSSMLPAFPSDAEYLDVVRALRLHGNNLKEAAILIGVRDGK
ncbi:MAG: hypothetical protein WCA92_03080 [Terriglobales bacterium]